VLPFLEISSLQLRQNHPQEALRAARSAVRVAPRSSAAHRAVGLSLQAAGEKEKGVVELRAAEALPVEIPEREARIVEKYARSPSVSPEVARKMPNPESSASANFDELSRQAAAAEAAGKPRDAIGLYQEALQLRPAWDEGRWHLAMLSYSAGDYSEAIASLKACVARQPTNGTAWAVLGLAEFETKDYGNARIHLERGQALGLSGSAASVQLATYRLAILLNQNGEFERATELLISERVTSSDAQEIQFALGISLLRIPLLPWQVETSKTNLIRAAGEIAPLLQESKYDEAFPRFQALLQQYPTTPFLHYVYGTALAALSQYDDAESELHQELLISPNSELPYLRLASIALKTHRPADAVLPAQRAVELASESAEAHYLLGRSWLELGQKEKALQELERASRLAPSSPEVHFNLAKAYAKANLPEKAEQERTTFARLNALAEEQRSHHGSQSYSGSHDPTDVSVHRAESGTPAPEAH
jgi:tetratricopeptide (TPR) repeat protein